MRSIPIDVLRAFVAVVEARGFTRAAEELGRSQPTISLQVKRLEELVEAPLFEKAARFELTAVGAVCFDYGKRLLLLHDGMLDEASRRKAPDAMLRVGVASEFAGRLAPRLGQLRPSGTVGTGFEVVTDASESLASAFRKLGGRGLSMIPVVDQQMLVGIVTMQNLMHSMALLAETRRLRKQQESG